MQKKACLILPTNNELSEGYSIIPINKTYVRFVCFLIFLPLLAFNTYVLSKHPRYNWDLLGYVAVSMAYEEKDPETIHLKAYEAVKESVPDKKFSTLIGKNGSRMHARYRTAMASHPDFFIQQLPFYSGKP